MLIWFIGAFAGYFVKGVCGFANTLIFSSIVSLFGGVANAAITPVELLLGAPVNVYMVLRNRQHIRLKKYLPIMLSFAAGLIPGAFFLSRADARLVKLIFGLLIALMGVQALFFSKQMKDLSPSPALLCLIGPVSGFMTGAYGIGALVATFCSRFETDTRVFKANMCSIFIAGDIIRFIAFISTGVLTGSVILQALQIAPFALAGLLVGMLCADRLSESAVRRLVNIFLILSGAALLLAAL